MNPTNTQSSFEESFKDKHKTFIGICSLFSWFNIQMLNSKILKIHLQFTYMRLLLTAKKLTGSNTYFDV